MLGFYGTVVIFVIAESIRMVIEWGWISNDTAPLIIFFVFSVLILSCASYMYFDVNKKGKESDD